MKTLALLAALALLSGCTTAGKHWWSPGTWFSGRAAQVADRAADALDHKKDEAVQAAHVEVAKTGEALTHAADSREIELARRFNGNAEALLTQGSGPLALAQQQELRKIVADLRSQNAQVRAAAEQSQQAGEQRLAKLSAELAAKQHELTAAQADLRTAFDRENALADQLRNERMVKWSLAGAALLCALGWAYVRYIAGGLPNALGAMLRSAERKSPALAMDVRELLDAHLDRNEQDAVRARFHAAQ